MMISDRDGSNLYFYNPHDDKIETIPHSGGSFSASNLYSTASGRYVAIVNGANHDVRFYDSGYEAHDDHAHKKGSPKFGKVIGSVGKKPTHYKSHKDHIIVFNDEEGTISYFKESEIHTATAPNIINKGQKEHHGAFDIFDNGNIAVTVKATVNPVSGTLPELVRIINTSGSMVHDTVLRTGGIHGSACNGSSALFGCTQGVLRVNSDGTQKIISNPSYFGTRWLGTLLFGKDSKKFYGLRNGFGLFEINIESETITPVDTAASFRTAAYDWEGHYLYTLHVDGTVKKINTKTGAILKQKVVNVSFPTTGSAGMPRMVGTSKYLYITDGINGDLVILDNKDLREVKRKRLAGKAQSMAFLGFDGADDHSH
ncbi:MAG: hypothetical protein SNJ77_11910 [Cytophagales bacterium]